MWEDMNDAGGWANSRGAVVDVLARLRTLGVRFAAGEAAQLLFSDDDGTKDVHGVQTMEGESIFADFVVLATGAWTSTLLPEELAETLLPTGQVVGTVQLSPEELSVYRAVPVTLMLDSGFYCFPVSPFHFEAICDSQCSRDPLHSRTRTESSSSPFTTGDG